MGLFKSLFEAKQNTLPEGEVFPSFASALSKQPACREAACICSSRRRLASYSAYFRWLVGCKTCIAHCSSKRPHLPAKSALLERECVSSPGRALSSGLSAKQRALLLKREAFRSLWQEFFQVACLSASSVCCLRKRGFHPGKYTFRQLVRKAASAVWRSPFYERLSSSLLFRSALFQFTPLSHSCVASSSSCSPRFDHCSYRASSCP